MKKVNSSFSWDLYHKAPVVGILRNIPLETVLQIVPVYLQAGFFTLEVTLNTPDAAKMIKTLLQEFPEMNIGAGTVCNATELNDALNAGSKFIVTPILNEAVIGQAVEGNIPIFPGAFTPTEIYRAWELGASAVKVFPATQAGVQYIKDLRGPLNDIKLLPTGGVSLANIKSFFDAGATGVGMGSSLFLSDLVREGRYDELGDHFAKVKGEIRGCGLIDE